MILIHIGAPKTGSTAIQNFLDAARDDLAQAGLVVPALGWKGGSGHSVFRASLNRKSDSMPDMLDLRATLNQTFDTGANVLLSSETLWTVAPRMLPRCYPALAQAQIMFLARSQPDIIASHYSQRVKSPLRRETRGIAQYFRDMADLYDYAAYHQHWSEGRGAGSVHPMIYEDASRATGGIVHSFMARVARIFGLPHDVIADIITRHTDTVQKRANARTSAVGTALMVVLNRAANLGDVQAQRLREAIALEDATLAEFGLTAPALISPELEAEIRSYYAASNHALAALLARETAEAPRADLFPAQGLEA